MRLATSLALAAALAAGCARAPLHGDAAGAARPFVAEGELATLGAGPGDAVALTGIAHATIGGSERVTLTFADSVSLPADTLGASRVEFRRDLGVVRVWLPERVQSTALADRFFGTTLLDRAYVVHGPGERWWVDLHVPVPAKARAWEFRNPSAIVVELEPGGEALRAYAPTGPGVVLLAPRGGPASYPLAIEGYARTFEANVLVSLRRGVFVRLDTFATARDYLNTWGHFALTIPDGPRDSLELWVGSDAGESGEFRGASVGIDLRDSTSAR